MKSVYTSFLKTETRWHAWQVLNNISHCCYLSLSLSLYGEKMPTKVAFFFSCQPVHFSLTRIQMITLIFRKSVLDGSLWKLNKEAFSFCQGRPASEPIRIVFEKGLHNNVISFILVEFLTFTTYPLKIETEATEKRLTHFKGKQDTYWVTHSHIKDIVKDYRDNGESEKRTA